MTILSSRKDHIYLDYNSTWPLLPGVFEAMSSSLTAFTGNPTSIHQAGRHARHIIERSRQEVASLLNVRRDQIIFTSGGTESINMAVKGVAYALKDRGRHVVATSVEHSATVEALNFLQRFCNFDVTWVGVDSLGKVDSRDVLAAVRPDTILISVIHAQNEVGTLQPVEEIIRGAHEKNVLVHVDGVQAAGKMKVDLDQLCPDLYSIAAHKIGGPKGVGALFLRDNLKIVPLIHGAHHERDLRAGTENVSGIAGFGCAAGWIQKSLADEVKRIQSLKDYLWSQIQERIPGVQVNGNLLESLCNTLNVSFDGLDGLGIALNLDLEGICVSTGSACLSGGIEPSPILKAMGCDQKRALGAVRFSLGPQNTLEELGQVVVKLTEIVGRLRS